MIELINQLEEADLLLKSVKQGLISSHFLMWRDIYNEVDLQMKVNNLSKRKAVLAAADRFNYSDSGIWYILKKVDESRRINTDKK